MHGKLGRTDFGSIGVCHCFLDRDRIDFAEQRTDQRKQFTLDLGGSGNVSGTLAGGITVNVNAQEVPETAWVIDTILRGGTAQRLVIPRGKISEMGDVVYKDNEVIGYEVTISCLPDSSGNAQYIYTKAAAST